MGNLTNFSQTQFRSVSPEKQSHTRAIASQITLFMRLVDFP